jgi:hypothetical protein
MISRGNDDEPTAFVPCGPRGNLLARVARLRCNDCGVVHRCSRSRQGPGLGGRNGGRACSAALSHQIGDRGNTWRRLLARARGLRGQPGRKNQKKKTYWAIAIRMDNGGTRNFTYTDKPAVNEGERVKLVDGGRRLALVAN